jgi:RNA polymerase sigma-70 factor (ECF subfamily)
MAHALEDGDLERTLAIRARNGDREAFGQLVSNHMRKAYAFALGIVGSPSDAMDLSQDAFVRAFRSMKRFKPGEPFYPWYYRILRNLCFNHLRDRARRGRILREASKEGLRPGTYGFTPSPEALAERNTVRKAVWEAIGTLKEEHREIIVLREFEGHSYKEIAELVGIPIGTVMSRLYAARKSLKAALDGVI